MEAGGIEPGPGIGEATTPGKDGIIAVGATPIGYLIDLYGPNALPVAIAASLLLLAYFAYRGEE